MPQYTFTSEKEFIEHAIQEVADREKRSRSEMIDILLHRAVKEINRKRNAKEVRISDYSADKREIHSG